MLSRRSIVWLAASLWAMRVLAADGATLQDSDSSERLQ
jgi:hypothetical protein